jgi:hypothetical protein
MQFLKAFSSRDEEECEFFLSAILAGIIQRGPGSPKHIEEHDRTKEITSWQPQHNSFFVPSFSFSLSSATSWSYRNPLRT